MAKPQPKPPAPAPKPQVARFALPKSSPLATAPELIRRGESPVFSQVPDGFDALAHHWNVMEKRAAVARSMVRR